MSAFVKDCDCAVPGCVVNDITTGVVRKPNSTSLEIVATFHGGPCCPKCHKPWRLVETGPTGRISIKGVTL